MIAVSENEKIIKNARHIDICYHHIWNLIEKKIIKISYISTDEIIADDLTKMLLSNKFKEFVELVRVSKIETGGSGDSKASNGETSNSKFNNDEASGNNKNDEKFMMNYYEKADKAADKTADKEISFKTEEAE